MRFEDLTPEQQERAKARKMPEDVLALIKEEGYELYDEELQAVSGGGGWYCSEKACESMIHNKWKHARG